MEARTTIVIPAYNEQETIEKTVSELGGLGPEYTLMVVDDGSNDDTAERAARAGAEVVSHPYNKGYGAALKTGVARAGTEIVVFFDADGQHEASKIPRMIEMMQSYDMVIGDRGRDVQTHAHRIPGKWLLGKTANFLVGHRIPDLNCGFRCVKRELARRFFHILPNGFSLSTTLTLAFFKEGLNVGFIPIATRKRSHGKSEVKMFRDGVKTLLLIMRITALFNPLKIFAPVGGIMIAIGMIYGLYFVIRDFNIPDGAVLSILFGILLIFFGVLADQIACIRRQVG